MTKMAHAVLKFVRSKAWWILGAVVLVAAGGWYYLGQQHSAGALFVVHRGDFIDTVSVSGKVVSSKDVDLGFSQSGRVSGVYTAVGDYVARGALIAEVENGDLHAVVSQKQAALAQAQADLTSIEAGTRPEEVAVAAAQVAEDQTSVTDALNKAYSTADDAVHNQVDQFLTTPRTSPKLTFDSSDQSLANKLVTERLSAENLLSSWQATLTVGVDDLLSATTQAQTILNAVATLLADANAVVNRGIPNSSVSQSNLSGYASDLTTARTNINTALATLNAAITKLTTDQKTLALRQAPATTADLAAGQAKVRSAQADVESAQAALGKTLVVAPFSGIITRMEAKVGSIVSPGESNISMESGTYQIETYVPEVNLSKLAVGQRASTTLDAYGSEQFPAVVVAIDPAETPQGGISTYKTTLQFVNTDPRIRSGLTANLIIVVQEKSDAITIPAGAVVSQDGQSYVWVAHKDTQTKVPIEVGLSSLGRVEVVSGLEDGDMVVLNPQ